MIVDQAPGAALGEGPCEAMAGKRWPSYERHRRWEREVAWLTWAASSRGDGC